jgi:hypothetical protein
MRRAGIKKPELDAFVKEACAGNLDHLLKTVMKTIEVEVGSLAYARSGAAVRTLAGHARTQCRQRLNALFCERLRDAGLHPCVDTDAKYYGSGRFYQLRAGQPTPCRAGWRESRHETIRG